MNKKWIAGLLAAWMLLMAGCGKKDIDPAAPSAEETQPQQTEQVVTQPTQADQPADETEQIPTEDAEQQPAVSTPPQDLPAVPTEETKPSKPETPTEPAAPTEGNNTMSYDDYMSMGAEEQGNYMDSFGSTDAFFDWLHSAKEEHDAQNPEIEVGDGSIDLGDLEGDNG